MKKKFLSLLMAVFMLIGLFTQPTLGYTSPAKADYLVLGDSISTGYGLADKSTESFASLLATDQNLSLNNQAVDGNTMAGLYTTLQSTRLDDDIAAAEIISITAGGNDLMGAFYVAVATKYNDGKDEANKITAADVPTIISNKSDTRNSLVTVAAFLTLSDFSTNAAFTTALSTYETNLKNVVNYISSKNSTALLFIDTQYNPYKSFESSNFYATIYTNFGACIDKLNAVIKKSDNGAGTKYQIVDVGAAFSSDANSATLCNATIDPLNLDFHPNKAGHVKIKETILSTLAHTVTLPEANTQNGITATVTKTNTASSILPNVPVELTITLTGNATARKTHEVTLTSASLTFTGTQKIKEGVTAGSGISSLGKYSFTMSKTAVSDLVLNHNLSVNPIALTLVTISKLDPEAGDTLTATVSPSSATADYQWLSDGNNILNATGSSYTVTSNDIGKKISVSATGTGEYNTTVTSTQSDKVVAKKITSVSITPATQPKVGDTLTAKSDPANATVDYQWQADGQDITGATGQTYTLTADELDKEITVKLKGTGNYGGEVISAKTAKVTKKISVEDPLNTGDTSGSNTWVWLLGICGIAVAVIIILRVIQKKKP